MASTPLEAEIRRRISLAGPMPVRQYMELCLNHPVHGYYTTRDPLGRDGDFITSPEVSQVFASLSDCGRRRPGIRWDSRRTCGWSSSAPAAAP